MHGRLWQQGTRWDSRLFTANRTMPTVELRIKSCKCLQGVFPQVNSLGEDGVYVMMAGRALAGFFGGTMPVLRAFVTEISLPNMAPPRQNPLEIRLETCHPKFAVKRRQRDRHLSEPFFSARLFESVPLPRHLSSSGAPTLCSYNFSRDVSALLCGVRSVRVTEGFWFECRGSRGLGLTSPTAIFQTSLGVLFASSERMLGISDSLCIDAGRLSKGVPPKSLRGLTSHVCRPATLRLLPLQGSSAGISKEQCVLWLLWHVMAAQGLEFTKSHTNPYEAEAALAYIGRRLKGGSQDMPKPNVVTRWGNQRSEALACLHCRGCLLPGSPISRVL